MTTQPAWVRRRQQLIRQYERWPQRWITPAPMPEDEWVHASGLLWAIPEQEKTVTILRSRGRSQFQRNRQGMSSE